MGIPETEYVRRKEIFQWLGISWYNLDQCVKAGLIHRYILPGQKYGHYLTMEIVKVFTKGVRYEDMGLAKVKVKKKKR